MKPRDWQATAAKARAERDRLKHWAATIYQLPPSARPYGQRGKYPKPPYPTAADGSRLCRWCLVPIGKGRWWCGRECVDEFMRRGHWPTMAKFITNRDKLCRFCGGARPNISDPQPCFEVGDTAWPVEGGWALARAEAAAGKPDRRPYACRLEVTWAVDHIVAVKDGGTDDPANLRLLCGRCHGEVTAAQHARWAIERRAVHQAAQQSLVL